MTIQTLKTNDSLKKNLVIAFVHATNPVWINQVIAKKLAFENVNVVRLPSSGHQEHLLKMYAE